MLFYSEIEINNQEVQRFKMFITVCVIHRIHNVRPYVNSQKKTGWKSKQKHQIH